jgi:hypothetical protein
MRSLVIFATAALVACGATGPQYSGTVRIQDKRLVAINPDVKTFVDVDRPVFFARGKWWSFDDGHWFRSDSPTGGFTHVKKPPVPVRQIDQPFAYVHYKKDQTGEEIETVATRPTPAPATGDAPASEKRTRLPTAIDPSVDPTTNLGP